MKRTIIAYPAIALALGLSSCSEGIFNQAETADRTLKQERTFAATIGDGTKTFFSPGDAGVMKQFWASGDRINVSVNSSGFCEFLMIDKEGEGHGCSKASFRGAVPVTDASQYGGGTKAGSDGEYGLAVYPDFGWYGACAGPVNHQQGPAHQYVVQIDSLWYTQQDYSPLPEGYMNLMVAPVCGDNLTFRNVSSFFEFKMKGSEKIGYVRIIARNEDDFIASCRNIVTVCDGKDIVEVQSIEGAPAARYALLICGDGVRLNKAEAQSFYIAAVLPTLKYGLTLEVYDIFGHFLESKHINSEVKVGPGEIQPFREFTLGGDSGPELTLEDSKHIGIDPWVPGSIWF